uniref:Uncharacterized protein n=1 Tax=Plectus sambesii TaxID=2011161 RepID=A0A914WY27_9BILA
MIGIGALVGHLRRRSCSIFPRLVVLVVRTPSSPMRRLRSAAHGVKLRRLRSATIKRCNVWDCSSRCARRGRSRQSAAAAAALERDMSVCDEFGPDQQLMSDFSGRSLRLARPQDGRRRRRVRASLSLVRRICKATRRASARRDRQLTQSAPFAECLRKKACFLSRFRPARFRGIRFWSPIRPDQRSVVF